MHPFKSFQLQSSYNPAGDQPEAIHNLTQGLLEGEKHQTLLGVTGSGKIFTIAHVIQNVQKPTLVLTHNKTLVAQLYGEFKQFFLDNAVGYFVSYYDYYQPISLPHDYRRTFFLMNYSINVFSFYHPYDCLHILQNSFYCAIPAGQIAVHLKQ